MSRSRFSLILVSIAACISWAVALPARAISWVVDLIPLLLDPRPLLDLFGRPSLVLASPAGPEISPALYNRNRHEAGMARLGTVRHI